MCRDCVVDPFPNRNRTCLEAGSYLLNFKACSKCDKRDLIKIENRKVEEEDDDETICYTHTCTNCSHIIAEHEYKFNVIELEQEYSMNCLLCGTGEDTVEAFVPKLNPSVLTR